ncbi:helix-turn-helix domain-containing protein [uncultured Cohaesibacter sp.]|uniref:helix-turn-helix domain-containing protein n=1 Tax=uncultured Cohaesibacter sp. TaxID=1002546 RepID=UPI003749C4DA
MMENRPFTPKTLADFMGCSESHIRRLCREKKLTHWRLGGKLIRIPREAVEELSCPNIASEGLETTGSLSGKTNTANDAAIASLVLMKARR